MKAPFHYEPIPQEIKTDWEAMKTQEKEIRSELRRIMGLSNYHDPEIKRQYQVSLDKFSTVQVDDYHKQQGDRFSACGYTENKEEKQ